MCIPSQDCVFTISKLCISLPPSLLHSLGLWGIFFRSFLQNPVIFCRNYTPQDRQKKPKVTTTWKFPHPIFLAPSSCKVIFECKQLIPFLLCQSSISKPFLPALPHAITYLASCFRRQVVEIINLFCKQILRKGNFEASYPVKSSQGQINEGQDTREWWIKKVWHKPSQNISPLLNCLGNDAYRLRRSRILVTLKCY